MPFDVKEFLANISSPDLRKSLNAQRDQERERAKEFDVNVGYLDAAGIMSKDTAKQKDASVVRQMVEADKVKRKIGEHTLQQEAYRQQIEAHKRKAAQDAALQAIFARPQQPIDDPMSPPVDIQGNAVPGIMAPPTRSGTAPSVDEQFMQGLPQNPAAINTEFGRDVLLKRGDPLRKQRLEIEQGQLDVNRRQLDLQEKKLTEPPEKTYADEPTREKKAELWDSGFYVTPNDKGGWDVKSRADKQNAAEVLAMIMQGGDIGKGKEKNPFAGPAAATGEPEKIPAEWVKYLKEHPESAASFDKKFGAGAAAKILEKLKAKIGN